MPFFTRIQLFFYAFDVFLLPKKSKKINMKKLLLLVLIFVMGLTVNAQQKTASVTIQTNGVCEQCKKRIMDNVPQWAGVKECKYDVKTAKLTVSYDTKLTNADKLRQGVSNLGYDADGVKANAEARAKLPACCRNGKVGQGCGDHSSSGCGGHSAGGCGGCNHHH